MSIKENFNSDNIWDMDEASKINERIRILSLAKEVYISTKDSDIEHSRDKVEYSLYKAKAFYDRAEGILDKLLEE